MKFFGREPALFVTQVNGGIVALLLLLHLPDVVTASIGGATTAVGGLIIAVVVRRERALPALIAVGRTIVTLAVVLGVKWDPAYQILVIGAFETWAGIFIRDRVVAPVDETGVKRMVAAPPLHSAV